MTDRSKLLALAGAVEKLTGPDREVDAQIAAALRIGTEHKWAENFPDWQGRADGRVYLEDGGASFAALAYTASLDAAMTLVHKYSLWNAGSDIDGPYGRVVRPIADGYVGSEEQVAWGRTPTLALCAAALRAQAEALS